MALSSSVVWEVRTTGSDNSGGGFVTGSGGTDYSQQDAAQFSGTDLTVDATTNTQVTSAAHSFTSADVGNLIQITAGAGFTTGFYQVASVASGAATLDRSPAAVGTSGGTWALGGALASPGKAAGAMVSGNDAWIKSGNYLITNTTANVAGGRITCPSGPDDTNPVFIRGYNVSRGDRGQKPVLKASGAFTSASICTIAGNWTQVENIEVDGAGLTSVTGFSLTGSATRLAYSRARNCTNSGIIQGGNNDSIFNEVTGCSINSAYWMNTNANNSKIYGCVSHDNTNVNGFYIQVGALVANCISYNNSGAAGVGFYLYDRASLVNCTSYNNGSDGVYSLNRNVVTLINTIMYGNGGYGVNPAASVTGLVYLLNCGMGSNTSGNYDVTKISLIGGVQTLTASPFTNAAGGDFSLNNTAGGGAALRAAGIPGTFPGGTTTGYLDIGAAQHQDSGGGGTTVVYTNAGGLGRL